MKIIPLIVCMACFSLGTLAHAAGKYDGTYRFKHSNGLQEVTITDDVMKIDIGNSNCGGIVSGDLVETERLVFFSNENKDTDERCIINVEKTSQGIKLFDEENCNYYHGATCSFEGIYTVSNSDDTIPDGGEARADGYSEAPAPANSGSDSQKIQSREDKIQIEKICRVASEQVYGLYLNAQNKVSSESSFKSLLPKLKKQKITDLNNEMLAQGLVDEIYSIYYKNGKLTKKDKKSDIEDSYFRNCMSSLIK